MKRTYSSGVDLKITIRNFKIIHLSGKFFNRGDTCKATEMDLTDKTYEIDRIIIRNPNEILVTGDFMHIYIEYFESVLILEEDLIIEV